MQLHPTHQSKKIFYIFLCICFAFLIILFRLFYLQINLRAYFFARSKKNYTRVMPTQSPRGNITDRNGILMATNRSVINVYWQGTGQHRLHQSQKKMIAHLETILDKTIIDDPSFYPKIVRAEKHRKQVLLAQDISFEQLSKLEEQLPNHANILLHTQFKRYYPYTTLASHVLGYLGQQIDQEPFGKMGLERLYQETLKGQHGSVLKTINSVGRNLAQIEIQKSLIGNTIQTTIDIQLQTICEHVFGSERKGTCIIMDPLNGDILALVSRPNFDPTLFLSPISHESWQNLQQDHPFLNRALQASYPPGSLFKLVSLSAALEADIISQDSVWECNGFCYFGGRKYWCNRRYGHGALDTAQAVAKSCNILFFEIGKKMDIDILASYAHQFGLGSQTNIIFPEGNGLVPTRAWKQKTKGEPWWPGETLSIAIGQSFLLVTPMQIACMISSIFTGYLAKPRFLLSEKIKTKPLQIKKETLAFLQQSMKQVVTIGTGKRVSKIKDFSIFAKTSTAQTSSMGKRHLGVEYLEHGWFVANIQYKQERPLTFVILVENAGSAQVATTIAKNFLLAYKKEKDTKN